MSKSLHDEIKIKSELEGNRLNTYLNQLINDGLRFSIAMKCSDAKNLVSRQSGIS